MTVSIGDARVSPTTATAVVVANMIGTGVFTSLGFQLADLQSGFAILMLWLVGGLAALSGALCYGEIGSALPRSGGEYTYLSRIYHPAVGFASGWISATVGFAAPVAAAGIALGNYAAGVLADGSTRVVVTESTPRLIAIAVIVGVSLIHLQGARIRGSFQNAFTLLKVLLILLLVLAGLLLTAPQPVSFAPDQPAFGEIISTPFAISLVWVMYAYSGWNAASYIAGEIEDPARNLPRALLIGTASVGVLYILVNFVFLRSTPIAAMQGQVEVGLVAATSIFGSAGGKVMGLLISLALVSSISAMIWAGPRVTMMIGRDIPFFRRLAATNRGGVPVAAVLLQLLISLGLVLTASFEQVINYTSFTLLSSSAVAVAGVFVLRHRHPELRGPYRTWGYPVTPVFFLGICGWMLAYLVMERPLESLGGVLTLVAGLVIWYLTRPLSPTSS